MEKQKVLWKSEDGRYWIFRGFGFSRDAGEVHWMVIGRRCRFAHAFQNTTYDFHITDEYPDAKIFGKIEEAVSHAAQNEKRYKAERRLWIEEDGI